MADWLRTGVAGQFSVSSPVDGLGRLAVEGTAGAVRLRLGCGPPCCAPDAFRGATEGGYGPATPAAGIAGGA